MLCILLLTMVNPGGTRTWAMWIHRMWQELSFKKSVSVMPYIFIWLDHRTFKHTTKKSLIWRLVSKQQSSEYFYGLVSSLYKLSIVLFFFNVTIT